MTITDAILKAKRDFKQSGYQINCGECYDFALYVLKMLDNPLNATDEATPFDYDDLPGHYWINFDGKYFDAECSKGVNDWKLLPIFKRYFKKNRSIKMKWQKKLNETELKHFRFATHGNMTLIAFKNNRKAQKELDSKGEVCNECWLIAKKLGLE